MIPRDHAAPREQLAAAEEADLARRARAGDRAARDRLIEANVPLAWKIARDLTRDRTWLRPEARGEAVLGLIRGVDGFDPGRGYRLSTYAGYWIRQRCRRWLWRHGGPIAPPDDLLNGRLPKKVDWHAQAERTRAARFVPLEDHPGLASAAEGPERPVERAEDQIIVAAAVDALPELERAALAHRFGLGGAELLTAREVATRTGRGDTDGAVRQRTVRALRRLRTDLEARGITA